jgi:hypothetical protein
VVIIIACNYQFEETDDLIGIFGWLNSSILGALSSTEASVGYDYVFGYD